jgi:hypothetical protein
MRITFLGTLSPKSPIVRNEEPPTRLPLHRLGTLVTGRLVLSMVVLLALTGLVIPAHAGPITQINLRAPFELLTVNTCTGEEVTITGETHLLGHLVEDESGSSHIRALVHLQGTGVGEAGTRYVISGTGNVASNNTEATGNGAVEGTAVVNASLISNGSMVNSLDRLFTHVTVNANGELTAGVLREESKCVG